MVDIETYIKELDQDLQVSAFNIKEVQLRLPSLKHKWAGRCIRHKQELFRLQKSREDKKKALVKELINTSVVKVNELVAERAVESGATIKEIDDNINNLKLVIELLEKSEKTLSSMTWDLKNMIDLQRLELN